MVMIPVSVALGVVAAVKGIWPLVAIMVLNLVFQVISVRAARQSGPKRD